MLLATPAFVGAQRRPVLQQIDLPHAYYYREMYVPQATSGPSAATWSPDGAELIYSMGGTLWRQRLADSVATELTPGRCYDYQPDWSPKGRHVVFASYCNDAIELRLLDLETGVVTSITENGGVNLDPRWSPDGTRIAFVSTQHNKRWHIHTIAIGDRGAPGAIERLTEDHDSGELQRYYYSRWDHFLSPTWSPDGREIIYISNRGRTHGTGGLWRAPARPGAPAREIRYEETTWKTRPDWSPDGRRVVYSSYLGRQWHQLWLTTSDGGDPFPLTYGDFDATSPRWSPNGRRIAFISNEGGNTSLRVIDVPGGSVRTVEPRLRRYHRPMGRVRITVTDSSGRQMPARVSVTDSSGRGFAPDDAWRHADEAFDRRERDFEYAYFHSRGRSDVTVPAGRVIVEVSRGPEYSIDRREIVVAPGQRSSQRVVLRRLADMPGRGWWSGDLHVHMNYGGAYRNTPRQLAFQARAEDLHVVENLIVNKEQRVPDIEHFRGGAPDPVSTRDLLVVHGQEFHTSVWGHAALIGLSSHYLLPDYAGYVNTAAASLYPDNGAVSELAHRQGALMGYVHPFDTRPDPLDPAAPLAYALPVDAALGAMDYLEVMGFSDHLATSEIWYRLLNVGFRIPAGGGTDAFPNFASLRGPPGLVRTYVKLDGALDHRRWLDGIRAGRTFVTNGPLLSFTVNGRDVGSDITLPPGSHELSARVTLRSHVPIDHLEIIGNGRVVATIPLGRDRMSATATVPVRVRESGWLVVRAYADSARTPVLDLYSFASTSPIYVTVGGASITSPTDVDYFLAWLDRVQDVARAHTAWNSDAERAAVLERIERARAEYRARRSARTAAR